MQPDPCNYDVKICVYKEISIFPIRFFIYLLSITTIDIMLFS